MHFFVGRSERPRKSDRLVFRIVLVIILLTLPACGEDYTFQGQWEEASRKADEILIRNHLCPIRGVGNCPYGQNLFVGPYAKGMQIEMYGIQDKDVIGNIADVFIDEFNKSYDMKTLQIRAYGFTKDEDAHLPIVRRVIDGPVLDIQISRHV